MINKIFALPVIEQLTPVLSRRQLDDLDLIVVDHPQVKASFALQGAHLLSWKPVGEEEVLWLSNNTPFKTGVALRGGVPICWPWSHLRLNRVYRHTALRVIYRGR